MCVCYHETQRCAVFAVTLEKLRINHLNIAIVNDGGIDYKLATSLLQLVVWTCLQK